MGQVTLRVRDAPALDAKELGAFGADDIVHMVRFSYIRTPLYHATLSANRISSAFSISRSFLKLNRLGCAEILSGLKEKRIAGSYSARYVFKTN